MHIQLRKIVEWLNCNKVSLNIDKTQYIIFRSTKKCPLVTSRLVINIEKVKHVKSITFLGVIIDECLNWTNHINTVKCKVARGIGILCKARKVLKSSTLLTLYNSFVFPYICYCIEVWGSACDKYISSLFKVQKRAVRIINASSYLAHTQPIFAKLNILNIYKIYKFKVALLMYKVEKHCVPKVVSDMFVKNADIHNYFTRQSNNLQQLLKKL